MLCECGLSLKLSYSLVHIETMDNTRQREADIASKMEPNGARFHRATQGSVQFKTYL